MITTRPATAADVPLLRAFLQALSENDKGGPVASETALLAHGFGARPLFRALIAERGSEALGMVLFYPDYSTHRGEPGLYVQDIYVSQSARGLGVGTTLLAAAMRAQDWGACYLTLSVDPRNIAAKSYYANRRFRPRGYDFLILDGEGLAALQTL